MTTSVTDAFQEGFNAYNPKVCRISPYMAGTLQHVEWRKGYLQAMTNDPHRKSRPNCASGKCGTRKRSN